MRFNPHTFEFSPPCICSYHPTGTTPDLGGSRKQQTEEPMTNQPPHPLRMWLIVGAIVGISVLAAFALTYVISLFV